MQFPSLDRSHLARLGWGRGLLRHIRLRHLLFGCRRHAIRFSAQSHPPALSVGLDLRDGHARYRTPAWPRQFRYGFGVCAGHDVVGPRTLDRWGLLDTRYRNNILRRDIRRAVPGPVRLHCHRAQRHDLDQRRFLGRSGHRSGFTRECCPLRLCTICSPLPHRRFCCCAMDVSLPSGGCCGFASPGNSRRGGRSCSVVCLLTGLLEISDSARPIVLSIGDSPERRMIAVCGVACRRRVPDGRDLLQ